MREFNERGAVDGLFDEMMALFPDLNPSKARFEDGFYVTDANRLISIEESTIHSLARDSDGSPCWVAAVLGEKPNMCAYMISLIDFFGLGWVPELFLRKRLDRGFDWDLPAMRTFLDFSRRVLDLDLPDLHYVELLDEKEEGPHFSYTYSRDLETGKIWRQACTWTSYYSDGYTFSRPRVVE